MRVNLETCGKWESHLLGRHSMTNHYWNSSVKDLNLFISHLLPLWVIFVLAQWTTVMKIQTTSASVSWSPFPVTLFPCESVQMPDPSLSSPRKQAKFLKTRERKETLSNVFYSSFSEITLLHRREQTWANGLQAKAAASSYALEGRGGGGTSWRGGLVRAPRCFHFQFPL